MWHFYDGIEGAGKGNEGLLLLCPSIPQKGEGKEATTVGPKIVGGKEEGREGLDFNSPATIFHPCGSGRPTVVVDGEDAGGKYSFMPVRTHTNPVYVAPRE